MWPERQTRKAARTQVTRPASQCICFPLSQNVGLSGLNSFNGIALISASRSTGMPRCVRPISCPAVLKTALQEAWGSK